MSFHLRTKVFGWTIRRLRLSTFQPKVHSGPLQINAFFFRNRSVSYFRIGQLYSRVIYIWKLRIAISRCFFQLLSRDCNLVVLILQFWDFQLSRESWAWQAYFEFLKNYISPQNYVVCISPKYDQLAHTPRTQDRCPHRVLRLPVSPQNAECCSRYRSSGHLQKLAADFNFIYTPKFTTI